MVAVDTDSTGTTGREARSDDRKHLGADLATHDMSRAVRFYAALGFNLIYGGENARFTSFRASYLNLTTQPSNRRWEWWGRAIFHVADVDAMHARVIAAGYHPDTTPRDATWGERSMACAWHRWSCVQSSERRARDALNGTATARDLVFLTELNNS